MTREELISKGSSKVRNTPDLLRSYIILFEERFGYRPKCAGCTFGTDWQKFVRESKSVTLKTETMIEKTFVLKNNRPEIISYKLGKKTIRAYSNTADDNYMTNYLTHGTPDQIAERKAKFKTLPKSFLAIEVAPEMKDWQESTDNESATTAAPKKKRQSKKK